MTTMTKKKEYYMGVICERDRTYIIYADEYIFDTDSRSVNFKIDGRVVKIVPLTDPKYLTVTVYNVDRMHYPDYIDMYIGGGAV